MSFEWGWSLKHRVSQVMMFCQIHLTISPFGLVVLNKFRLETSSHWHRETGVKLAVPKHDITTSPTNSNTQIRQYKVGGPLPVVSGVITSFVTGRGPTCRLRNLFFVRGMWHSVGRVSGESCAFNALQTRRIGMEGRNCRMAFQWRGVLYSCRQKAHVMYSIICVLYI